MQKIGLIGLGNAGRPMAERILAAGYALTVFDIDAAAVAAVVTDYTEGTQPITTKGPT